MLKTLRIRDLAIIADVSLEFGPGFSLLTGETGAGKSIVVDALGLAAGDRADTTLVRSGAERAIVEAVFQVDPGSDVPRLLEERGLDAGGSELIVRREVPMQGSGRVFLNGSPAPLAVLRELGGRIVELHGQHEHQSLLLPERHQELLDRFGGLAEQVRDVAAAFDEVVAAAEDLERLAAAGAERDTRIEALRAIVREIEALAPRPGETDDLAVERGILRNQGRVQELLGDALSVLHDGDATAGSLASLAARKTAELAAIDPTLAELAQRLESVRVDLDDAGAVLRDYRECRQFEPGRLETVEARLAALERLRLRYGADDEAILRERERAAGELAQLDDLDAALAGARSRVLAAENAYASAARALTRARRTAASRLSKAIADPLAALGMPKATLEVALPAARGRASASERETPVPIHRRGAERVEFLFSANPGEVPRPFAKVVSGGELSRVMLALHGVLEGAGEGRVLVFDEVDAGIGGSTADAVGSRLARIATRNQVLCVTHLPQVAAHGNGHYHVRKTIAGGRATVEVLALDDEGRVEELARMLGGKEASAASRKNAEALLAGALAARGARGASGERGTGVAATSRRGASTALSTGVSTARNTGASTGLKTDSGTAHGRGGSGSAGLRGPKKKSVGRSGDGVQR